MALQDVQLLGGRASTSNPSLLDKTDPGSPAGERAATVKVVSKLCQQGRLSEAVEALGVLVQTQYRVSKNLVYAVLKLCVDKKDLPLGRRVHALSVTRGYELDTFLCNHFLRMYAARARLQEAMDVFTMVAKPDAFMWSSIISAHVKHGRSKEAIQLYHQMRRSGVKPDGHVLVAALQACARGGDLNTGQEVHAHVLANGGEPDLFVLNSLVDMYAKCGGLDDAKRVFDRLALKDVVTWNAMIAGYSKQGMGQEAFRLYSAMQEDAFAAPNSLTFSSLLQACSSLGTQALEEGRQLHAQIKGKDLQSDLFVANSLINMYGKCGSLEDAQRVFDGLGDKNVVTWNAMIAAYSQEGMGQEALRLHSAMQPEGKVAPSSVTFVSLLQACAIVGVSALEKGKQLHEQIGKDGLEADVVLGCSLVNMYVKCGSLLDAQLVFDGLKEKNVVTWTALIAGYSHEGMQQKALGLYSAMQEEGMGAPDAVTFVCLLQACASVGNPALETGKQLHAQIQEQGVQADLTVGNNLIAMYAKCGSLKDAERVFDSLIEKDVVTWNVMISGYSQHGMDQEALRLYSAMQEEGVAAADAVTFLSVLQACASVAALQAGRQLHVQIKEKGLETDVYVATGLINMYAKSGSMVEAQQVFDAMPERDDFAWNALIAGYTRQGDSDVVFVLIQSMREDGVPPNGFTFLSVLTVCSHAGLVNKGQDYFEAMSKTYNVDPTAEHYACMVDILGRAGKLDQAVEMIRAMPMQPHDVVWHTLLAACRKWCNVEVGRYAFEEAMKLDAKDEAAFVLMSNVYIGAQMWEEAHELQARRVRAGAWKQPGQTWWTDMDGLVHTFLVGHRSHSESEGIYGRHRSLLNQNQNHDT